MNRKFWPASALGRLFLALTVGAVTLAVAYADSVDGGVSDTDTLSPRTSMTYRIRFQGGETARAVATTEDDDDDIDMYVYNANGVLVDKDTEPDNTPVCEWRPSRTGTYRIVVRNAGSYTTDYAFVTN